MRVSRKTGFSGDSVTSSGGDIPYLPGHVTKENFLEKALAFMRASGRSNGEHPVIKRNLDLVAWSAWTTFLRRLGFSMKAADRIGVLTVPTALPWDFSVDADDLRDVIWQELPSVVPYREELTVEDRKTIAQRLRLPRLPDMVDARRAAPNSRLKSRFDEARAPTSP